MSELLRVRMGRQGRDRHGGMTGDAWMMQMRRI